MAIDFIVFKGYVSLTYSSATTLNLAPSDFGDDMITITYPREAVKRFPSATGEVASPQLYVPFEATLHIKKTSPQYPAYAAQMQKNAVIDGTATVVDDTNTSYQLTTLSLKPGPINANANDNFAQFILEGILLTNTTLIADIS